MLELLNKEQQEAVRTIYGPLLILAGAGTGKTRVITERIIHMLETGIPAHHIQAVTFTNKAAKEMKARLQTRVRGDLPFIGTFHRFGLDIIRQHHQELNLSRNFSIAGTSDQLDLLRRTLKDLHFEKDFKPYDALEQISKAKSKGLLPEDVDDAIIAEIYRGYQNHLSVNRVIDFDDCIFLPWDLCRKNPEIRQNLQKKCQYFFVDEFQDTNLAQLSCLHQVVSDAHNVCVVGDDDQSIYSWRGAMYEVFETFESLFPNTKVVKLEQNYRCPQQVLHFANKVIEVNTKRKPKELWSQIGVENPIHLQATEDEKDENSWVTNKIMAQIGSGVSPKQVCILYRTGAQASGFELELKNAGINAKTFGGQSMFERKEVKDLLAYMRIAANPNDVLAFWRALGTPARGIGLKTAQSLEKSARETHQPLFKILSESVSSFPAKTSEKAQAWLNLIQDVRQRLDTPQGWREGCLHILKNSGIKEYYRKNYPASKFVQKWASLELIPDWLEKVAESAKGTNGKINRRDVLDRMSLESNLEKKDEDAYVSLLTIHAAKGLEFAHVFVTGLEDDLLPHRNSITPLAVAEERRLFYVAVTRAQKNLWLTYAKKRQKIHTTPSRFLKELDLEELQAAQQREVEEKDSRVQGTLNKLRSWREGG